MSLFSTLLNSARFHLARSLVEAKKRSRVYCPCYSYQSISLYFVLCPSTTHSLLHCVRILIILTLQQIQLSPLPITMFNATVFPIDHRTHQHIQTNAPLQFMNKCLSVRLCVDIRPICCLSLESIYLLLWCSNYIVLSLWLPKKKKSLWFE